jgi:hypothetical protein
MQKVSLILPYGHFSTVIQVTEFFQEHLAVTIAQHERIVNVEAHHAQARKDRL